MGIFIFFAPVTLTLTPWPSYTNLTRILWRYTVCVNMNSLYIKAFESYRLTDRPTRLKLYTTPLGGWSIIWCKLASEALTSDDTVSNCSSVVQPSVELCCQSQLRFVSAKPSTNWRTARWLPAISSTRVTRVRWLLIQPTSPACSLLTENNKHKARSVGGAFYCDSIACVTAATSVRECGCLCDGYTMLYGYSPRTLTGEERSRSPELGLMKLKFSGCSS